MTEKTGPTAKIFGWRFGDRLRVLRAVRIACEELKASGAVFGSKDDALAAVLTKLQAKEGRLRDLLDEIDWDRLLEILDQMLPLILALIQMFLL